MTSSTPPTTIEIQNVFQEGFKSASSIDAEAKELDIKALKLKNKKKKLKLKALRQYFKARKQFAQHIFTLVCVWLFFILIIVVASGQKKLELSDTVLVALITTTTINVSAFLVIVANFLFPNKKKSEKD
ncbi:MAG TPA: hypothetical protein VEC12_09195 [Bacteroidia bacterium]|nr:hypothetical protein [Bacteroidia bacterium]